LELLPIKDIITSQKTDQYSKIPTTKSKVKKWEKITLLKQGQKLPQIGGNKQGFLPNTLTRHKSYYCSRCLVTAHREQEHT